MYLKYINYLNSLGRRTHHWIEWNGQFVEPTGNYLFIVLFWGRWKVYGYDFILYICGKNSGLCLSV